VPAVAAQDAFGSSADIITRIGNRLALSQIASVAMAETRLAGRATHNALRHLAPIVAWAVASIILGLIVGLAAVVLPPLGSFGIVAAAGVVLLWVMPDLPLVSPGLIRKAFFVMIIADLSIPFIIWFSSPACRGFQPAASPRSRS
jgi:hypothetical protein